jgi:hypothetical protein
MNLIWDIRTVGDNWSVRRTIKSIRSWRFASSLRYLFSLPKVLLGEGTLHLKDFLGLEVVRRGRIVDYRF